MDGERLRVEVVAALPERQCVRTVDLPPGATVEDALVAADLAGQLPGLEVDLQKLGIFGRLCPPDRVLQDGDRVEIYRALKVDPKQVRRQLAELERARQRSEAKA